MAIIVTNAAQLICVTSDGATVKRGGEMRDLAIIENGAVIIDGERLSWVGASTDLPAIPPGAQRINATGKIVLPGFIDSHTHLISAGAREHELDSRLEGLSYQEISAQGGGINATVEQVRRAARAELTELAKPRLERLLRFGVTTVEVKSGYGLSLSDELKCLEVVADLNTLGPWELIPTFLGAHAVPPEYRSDRGAYVRLLLDDMIPEIVRSRLAEFCDVFCEAGVFSLLESEAILVRARALGLRLKVHADELTPLGGTEMAARLGAVSADHLLCITERGIEALAQSPTVANLLPGTAFFLGLPYAPARRLIDGGVPVALASDCNPGTCPTENLPLIGTMACTQMGMFPAEVVSALTINAAAALGLGHRIGSLEAGKQADLIICDVKNYQQLFYHFGVNHVWRVVKRGRVVYAA